MNIQILGFACIAALVAGGVDYHQQTLKAEKALGELSVGTYVGTITERFSDMQASKTAERQEREDVAELKVRRKAGARTHLPDAPEGWTRRAWDDGDNSAITKRKRPLSEIEREVQAAEEELLNSSDMLKGMKAASDASAAQALIDQTWVYERGDDVISVRARFREEIKGNSMTAGAGHILMANMNAMSMTKGWGVIQGVGFGENSSFLQDQEETGHYRTLRAVIGFGDEVSLEVRTNASDAATREILEHINYDGLNALLPRPLAHVGSNAPDVPLAQQPALAERMAEIRQELLRKRGQAAEEWMMGAASPEDAMTIALRQAGFNIAGSMADEDAALEAILEETQQAADMSPVASDEANAAPADTPERKADAGNAPRQIVSKPLGDDKIRKLEAMSAPERRMALAGLESGVRKFEAANGLEEGACAFSLETYRVECTEDHAALQASPNAGDAASGTGGLKSVFKNFFGSGSAEDAPAEPPAKRFGSGGGTLASCSSDGSYKKCKLGD